MLVVADNDVIGAVGRLRRVLESDEWAEYVSDLAVRFSTFDELGLAQAPDRLVWQTCQNSHAMF
jgi:hypothetical protein